MRRKLGQLFNLFNSKKLGKTSKALNKEFLLKESKYFCMLPWVHMHLWPNGNTFPCCIADSSMPIGTYGEGASLQSLWNSSRLKAIRQNMLSDRPSKECSRCYLLEDESKTVTLRISSNLGFAGHFEKVEKTGSEGSVKEMSMAYLDIRFSNLCNFRCQTCGPALSSSWHDDQVKIAGRSEHAKVIRISPNEKFWEELRPLLLGVEDCYFAGGEPLITDEIFQIMDHWLANGKVDHQITFTTNFSQVDREGRNVFDYWNRFKKVRINASLDASGARAEYLRKGTDWARIEKNRQKMLQACPQVEFVVNPTISVYNVLHFPDFHLDWVKKKLIHPDELQINLLSYPTSMSIRMLPEAMKQRVEEKYHAALAELMEISEAQGRPTDGLQQSYQSILIHLRSADTQSEIQAFFDRARLVDKARAEDLLAVFPELSPLLSELKKDS